MSGFSFPSSQNKWTGIAEAKHPLIQELIKLWEESPGYILPQGSFIKDKAKLEALIDSLIEAHKQKPLATKVAPVKAVAPVEAEDAEWEKKLLRELSSAKLQTKMPPKADVTAPLPPLPDLTKLAIPKGDKAVSEEKLAQLKLISQVSPELKIDTSIIENGTKPASRGRSSVHLIILYAISGTAFILALIALSRTGL